MSILTQYEAEKNILDITKARIIALAYEAINSLSGPVTTTDDRLVSKYGETEDNDGEMLLLACIRPGHKEQLFVDENDSTPYLRNITQLDEAEAIIKTIAAGTYKPCVEPELLNKVETMDEDETVAWMRKEGISAAFREEEDEN